MQPRNSSETLAGGDGHEKPSAAAPARGVTAAPGTGRRLSVGVAIFAVVLIVAFLIVHLLRSRQTQTLDADTAAAAGAAPAVDVVRVRTAPDTNLLTLPGETRGWYESTIYARVSGYAADWLVDIGDRVKKGQVLATIDTPELDAQLAATQAKLKASQAEVKVSQSSVDFAKSNYERIWFSPKGVVAQQDRDQAKAEYEGSIAKLNAADAQVNLDQADVDRLNSLEAFKKVTAPFAGIITDRRIDIGDLVTAGSTASTTSLFAIEQADKIRVFVDVPQAASAQIKVGMAAPVTTSEFIGRVFTGTVARTAGAIDPASRTLRVEVDIANPDLALLSGMYVQVAFSVRDAASLQIPASALVFRSTGPAVAVIDDADRVSFHDVSIARDQGDVVQIGSGLAKNDRIALNISSQIVDGQLVRPIESDEPAAPAPHEPVAQTNAAASPGPDQVIPEQAAK